MFKVGDIVRVKPEKREFIRGIYSGTFWSARKKALANKAADGIKLIVKEQFSRRINGIVVADLEDKYHEVLKLQEENFELAEKQVEVDEGAMFALL